MTRAETGSKFTSVLHKPAGQPEPHRDCVNASLRVFLCRTTVTAHCEPRAVLAAPPSSFASRLRRSAEPSSPLRPKGEDHLPWLQDRRGLPQGAFPCDSVTITHTHTHTRASAFVKACDSTFFSPPVPTFDSSLPAGARSLSKVIKTEMLQQW